MEKTTCLIEWIFEIIIIKNHFYYSMVHSDSNINLYNILYLLEYPDNNQND
jgi:hypothetical protein